MGRWAMKEEAKQHVQHIQGLIACPGRQAAVPKAGLADGHKTNATAGAAAAGAAGARHQTVAAEGAPCSHSHSPLTGAPVAPGRK